MSLSEQDVARMLVALTLLLIASQVMGYLFARLRQPVVVGEILGGLLLGPTVLGALAPGLGNYLFPESGITTTVLGATYQLGLLFLMFLAGAELRPRPREGERRTVAAVAVTGLVLPFGVGIGTAHLLDPGGLTGPNGSGLTLTLVFGIALAVTSVPVISRIMLDLGIMHTSFARVVLSVAIIEDLVLYAALAAVLGLAQAGSAEYGLIALLPVESVAASAAYYISVSMLFFLVFLSLGPRLFGWLARHRANVLERRSPTAFRLAFLLLVALGCILLGINPIFGALLAGASAARGDALACESRPSADLTQAWTALRQFCMAFFVPLYFAGVGLSLDLVHQLDPLFFVWFLLLACVAKFGSVLLGARVAGEPPARSVHLAVALNARGGPGIVLATVTLAAGIINESFFTALVLLSIITSQLAGTWLDFSLRRPAGAGLGEEPATRPEGPTLVAKDASIG
jgi:Kef-type K+ transport system membrane component KefB